MIRYKNIYILPSRPNHEDFNDDPEALLDLPLSEKTSEFWKRYDRLADSHDNKMTEDLSENLDVLLISAALFSAINTAFISLTMPGLSPDPLTETNGLLRLLVTIADNNTLVATDLSPPFTPPSSSVIVNCLLYASLSCSLLAAVAAMMAKEWLQSFERTGQTGPLEEQGRFRQRKFNGVQQWHLESIVRSLPNILLFSVIFFFAGVCLFLLPVNGAVAGVVLAFSGGGAVLGGIAIIAGATSPLCPYQSAASRAAKPLWAKIFGDMDPNERSFNRSYGFTELMGEDDHEIVLARHLSNAVVRGTRVLSTSTLWGNSQSELLAVHGYAVCLQRAAELSLQLSQAELTDLIDSVAGFILGYVDPLTSSNPEVSSSESVRVSIEAVLALQGFIGPTPRPDVMRSSWVARAEQLRIDDLIDAVVHIMLDDCERLATSKWLPRTQLQTLAWVRAQALAPAEVLHELVQELVEGLGWKLGPKRVRVRVSGRVNENGQELELEMERELMLGPVRVSMQVPWLLLVREPVPTLERALERARGGALDDEVLEDGALEAGDGALEEVAQLTQRLALKLANDLAQRLQVESSILRILLWVWKRTFGTQTDHSDKRKIFISSCPLWAPLETRVELTTNGIEWGINGERLTFDDGNPHNNLTPDDLNGILEFAEDLQKGREQSEFIARNADVGINRLYVHFNRRVDWSYDLYDLREPRTLCSRSMGMDNGLI